MDEQNAVPEQIPDGQPVAPAPGSFSRAGTVLWSIALAVLGTWVLWSVNKARDQGLERPEAYLARIVGRDLDAAEAMALIPKWQRLLNAWTSSSPTEALDEAIDTYQEYRRRGVLNEGDTAECALGVFLGEAGRLNELKSKLEQLPEDSALVLREAYLTSSTNIPHGRSAVASHLSPRWARDKLEERLALRSGDDHAVQHIEARMQARGKELQDRVSAISAVNLLLVAAGLAAAIGWLARSRPPLQVGSGVAESPWPVLDGYAVLVRGAVIGMVFAGGLALVAQPVPFLTGISTPLAAAPLFWLASKVLLLPRGLDLFTCFGLRLNVGEWKAIGWLTLAASAAMIGGETVLGALTDHLDAGSLSESIPEDFVFGRGMEVLLSSIDAVIWAPLVEEVVFRGFLYTTLRRRLPMAWAAVLSSVIFAAVHGYSFAGFVTIFWSGMVWAWLYEKSRTLWPGILCHAASNALATLSPMLLYRW